MRLIERAGFHVVRQRGSRVTLQRGPHKTVVPLHEELAKGTLLGVLKQCGMTRDDLRDLMEQIGARRTAPIRC